MAYTGELKITCSCNNSSRYVLSQVEPSVKITNCKECIDYYNERTDQLIKEAEEANQPEYYI